MLVLTVLNIVDRWLVCQLSSSVKPGLHGDEARIKKTERQNNAGIVWYE